MLIIKFIGGLGNQMFQYAFYKSLEKMGKDVKADISGYEDYELHNGFELEKIFGINLKYANMYDIEKYIIKKNDIIKKIMRKVSNDHATHIVCKDAYKFENHLYKYNEKYLEGYWQNISYFRQISEIIKEEFKFKDCLTDKNLFYFEEAKNNPNSVAIHIRRGDYLDKKNNKIYGDICKKEYYLNAIKYINNNINNPRYYIFSNDIRWVQENLKIENAVFIDWNKDENSYIDMQLMSACNNNIIANSTFSWWGAYLNPYKNKIIVAPKKWTNVSEYNLAEEDWIKI